MLPTYDFVDVVNRNTGIGWQVKATKHDTPVTWKRMNPPDKVRLFADSKTDATARQELGDAILNACNYEIRLSRDKYHLNTVAYSRLIVGPQKTVRYFERVLLEGSEANAFSATDYRWDWSEAEELEGGGYAKGTRPALNGFHRETGAKWWAWHGHGENQLHFVGEKNWWPQQDAEDAIVFDWPESKIRVEEFLEWIETRR